MQCIPSDYFLVFVKELKYGCMDYWTGIWCLLEHMLSFIYLRFSFQISNFSGAWIITQATNKSILNCFSKKTVCIGIASWGSVYNRKLLTKFGKTVYYHSLNHFLSETTEETGVNLEKRHTHFLLVDDGHINKVGGEIEFRINLEEALRRLKDSGNLIYILP